MSRTKSLWHLFIDAERLSDGTSPHRKVVFAFLRHPCRCSIRAQVCGKAGVALQGSQRVKSSCSFSHSSYSAFVSLLIQQSSKLYCLHGQREGRALHCNRCYWAQGNICKDLLSSGRFSATEQRKKHKKQPNHQLLTVLLTALHFQAVLAHRMASGEFHYASWFWFTARCLLFPQVPARIFVLPLFLNGSLPTPRGPLLPCDNSLLAARSLLGKIKSTGEDEVCQSFFHARQSIISICCEHLTFTGKSDDPASISIPGMQPNPLQSCGQPVIFRSPIFRHGNLRDGNQLHIIHSTYTSSVISSGCTSFPLWHLLGSLLGQVLLQIQALHSCPVPKEKRVSDVMHAKTRNIQLYLH